MLNAFERRAERLSTASKMKRRSVDIIFLCKLEKFEKYFPVNWGIIIEYIHKHYIKQIIKNTESLCNIGDCILVILSICLPNMFI